MTKTVEYVYLTAGGQVGGTDDNSPEEELMNKLNKFVSEHPGNWTLATVTDIGGYAQRHLFAWLERTED